MSGRVYSDVHVPVCGQDGQGKARKGEGGTEAHGQPERRDGD